MIQAPTPRLDGGWVLRPAWWMACLVVLLTQLAVWVLAQAGASSAWVLVGGLAVEAHGLGVAYRLIKPNKIIYLQDKSLLVCDHRGRKYAHVQASGGFASPFFIGIALGRYRHLGVFPNQLSCEQFGALLRWVRWP